MLCPECHCAVILWQYPHKDAGIWECQNPLCGASDACEHENQDSETLDDGSHIAVCTKCLCTVGEAWYEDEDPNGGDGPDD